MADKQLETLAKALDQAGYYADLTVTDRLRITHDESIVTYWVAKNNDGKDRFYEVRTSETPGVLMSFDLPIDDELLIDGILDLVTGGAV